ncbi:FliA/WhiG family RNA polymerase sigma factor [Chlamydiifrater phoenicopteri]|uniref:FliA/WhiG family RNA polymerase sigma factor n=1 Tax=Chlamydiifrater phoenicopteri TaxID=2681469 RepID=UPI001BCEC837|nr:FliA/WhiG family RNA polymerase sigma factor [Chlamydiifrater phoenicopteri]
MKTQDFPELSQPWKRYLETRAVEDRDFLIETYLYLVNIVAHKLSAGFPSHIHTEDLYAAGVEGLVRAVEKFNPEKSPKFEGYAAFLIKASIIDDLRKQDWVPRSVHKKANLLSSALEALRSSLSREPSDSEVCKYLGISQEELSEWYQFSKTSLMISIHEDRCSRDSEEKGFSLEDRLVDEKAMTGFEMAEKEERKKLLAGAILNLEERERQVLVLYYYEDLMLKEIGNILGVSESRVSQIHSKALLRLRSAFKNLL